jgi:hypothetical protein
MNKPWVLERIRICRGWGFGPTAADTVLLSGQAVLDRPAGKIGNVHPERA